MDIIASDSVAPLWTLMGASRQSGWSISHITQSAIQSCLNVDSIAAELHVIDLCILSMVSSGFSLRCGGKRGRTWNWRWLRGESPGTYSLWFLSSRTEHSCVCVWVCEWERAYLRGNDNDDVVLSIRINVELLVKHFSCDEDGLDELRHSARYVCMFSCPCRRASLSLTRRLCLSGRSRILLGPATQFA